MSAPLDGIRLLDCTASLSGSSCTATLARLGADVARVHVDGGRYSGSGSAFVDGHLADSDLYREFLGRGMAADTIDLGDPAGVAALRELVSQVDVIVEDGRDRLLAAADLEPRDLVAPGLPTPVLASVTPHGRSGPRQHDLASDLTMFHGAGPGHAVPGLVEEPATMPPLRLGSHQGSFVAGLVAAINVTAAVLARRLGSGSDAPREVVVDVSCHEALANAYRQSIGTFAFYGGGLNRDLARGRGAGGMVDHRNLACKDGYVNIAWGGVQQWDSLRQAMGEPDWMAEPDVATPLQRYRNWATIVPQLEQWTMQHDKEQLLYLCQGWRIPCAPVNDGSDLVDSGMLRDRGFWRSVPGLGPAEAKE